MALEKFTLPSRIATDPVIKTWLARLDGDMTVNNDGVFIEGCGCCDWDYHDIFDHLQAIHCPFEHIMSGGGSDPCAKTVFTGEGDADVFDSYDDGSPLYHFYEIELLFEAYAKGEPALFHQYKNAIEKKEDGQDWSAIHNNNSLWEEIANLQVAVAIEEATGG